MLWVSPRAYGHRAAGIVRAHDGDWVARAVPPGLQVVGEGGGQPWQKTAALWLRAGTCQVSVVDLTGRTVQASTGTVGTRLVPQLQQLPAGAYVVFVRGASVQLSRRLVKE